MFIKKALLYNYADDSTLPAFATDVNDLIETLTVESQETIDWLKLDQMIVNPKSFNSCSFLKRKMPYRGT